MTDIGVENQGDFGNPADDGSAWQTEPPQDMDSGASAEEVVERQLAQYVFVREERDREVRLHFRDVPPQEIARAFRVAGAYLITLMGERSHPPEQTTHDSPILVDESEIEGQAERRRAPRHVRPHLIPEPTGDAAIRYFYSLGETVYTVSIASTSGVFGSIAGVYPLATRLEREASERAAVMFISR